MKMRNIVAWYSCLYFCLRFNILLNSIFKPMLAISIIAKKPDILVMSFRRPQNYLRIFWEICLMNISENWLQKYTTKMCLYVCEEYLKLLNEGRVNIRRIFPLINLAGEVAGIDHYPTGKFFSGDLDFEYKH